MNLLRNAAFPGHVAHRQSSSELICLQPPKSGSGVGCDWRTAGHVTTVLPSDWSAGTCTFMVAAPLLAAAGGEAEAGAGLKPDAEVTRVSSRLLERLYVVPRARPQQQRSTFGASDC